MKNVCMVPIIFFRTWLVSNVISPLPSAIILYTLLCGAPNDRILQKRRYKQEAMWAFFCEKTGQKRRAKIKQRPNGIFESYIISLPKLGVFVASFVANIFYLVSLCAPSDMSCCLEMNKHFTLFFTLGEKLVVTIGIRIPALSMAHGRQQ